MCAHIPNVSGLDVDYEWQIPQIEWWLKTFGQKNGTRINKPHLVNIVRMDNPEGERILTTRLDKNEHYNSISAQILEEVIDELSTETVTVYPETNRLKSEIARYGKDLPRKFF